MTERNNRDKDRTLFEKTNPKSITVIKEKPTVALLLF